MNYNEAVESLKSYMDESLCVSGLTNDKAKEVLKLLEQYRWHLAAETVPEPDELVLVTVLDGDMHVTDVRAAAWGKDEGWIIDHQDEMGPYDVLAWMRMPEAYAP